MEITSAIEQLIEVLETKNADLKAAQKDAARYRALRDRCVTDDPLKSPWAAIGTYTPLFAAKEIYGSTLDVMVDEVIAINIRSKS